ncbi:hypothetical protein RHMOL_Rhmol02G0106200 [Rhododendron molle]|uniref:Uncharacterized protein n=1 Tax=Rhododendron molle TaxID=49168 RepID=A0ACC0PNF0_RHOML|nr:hypothetical protein RHMOL_Rhmol02G0106200 [Rhododendron molle]
MPPFVLLLLLGLESYYLQVHPGWLLFIVLTVLDLELCISRFTTVSVAAVSAGGLFWFSLESGAAVFCRAILSLSPATDTKPIGLPLPEWVVGEKEKSRRIWGLEAAVESWTKHGISILFSNGYLIWHIVAEVNFVVDFVFLHFTLLFLYPKCAILSSNHQLFDEMPHRNVVT